MPFDPAEHYFELKRLYLSAAEASELRERDPKVYEQHEIVIVSPQDGELISRVIYGAYFDRCDLVKDHDWKREKLLRDINECLFYLNSARTFPSLEGNSATNFGEVIATLLNGDASAWNRISDRPLRAPIFCMDMDYESHGPGGFITKLVNALANGDDEFFDNVSSAIKSSKSARWSVALAVSNAFFSLLENGPARLPTYHEVKLAAETFLPKGQVVKNWNPEFKRAGLAILLPGKRGPIKDA